MGKKKKGRGGVAGAMHGTIADQLAALASTSEVIGKGVGMADANRRLEEERERAVEEYRPYLLQHNGKGQDGAFINPYTFFALEDDCEPQRERARRYYGGYTGKLTCTVEVHEDSPLFIPNTTSCFVSDDHRSFDFFSYDDLSGETELAASWPADREPVIPGSSLRGAVRSVYEQLTNSCFSQIDEKNYPNKRTNEPKKPYRMEYDETSGKRLLYEIEVVRVGPWHHAEDTFGVRGAYSEYVIDEDGIGRHAHGGMPGAEKEYVMNRGALHRCDPGEYPGEVHYAFHPTGEMNRKHLTLFPLSGGTFSGSLDEGSDALGRFERVVDAYCAESTEKLHNSAATSYREYKKRYDNKLPILVYADETLSYLSPACMTREFFTKTIEQLLKESGHHDPCDGGDGWCPACRLFGAVGDAGSLGGRVRFSDARPIGQGSYEFTNPTTLPILANPKIGATEFYLKRPADRDAKMWNYDYYTKGRGYQKERVAYSAKLNGRKVYLHYPMNFAAHYERALLQPSNQNATVRPLRRGTFTFDVYFEDVSNIELANLVFALGGANGRLQKLGHGKPLGMGSVEMKVTAIEKKKYSVFGSQAAVEEVPLSAEDIESRLPSYEASKARRRLVEHFAKDLSTVPVQLGQREGGANTGILVRYPTPNAGPMNQGNLPFKWFGNNRGRVNDPEINKELYVPSLRDMGDKQ